MPLEIAWSRPLGFVALCLPILAWLLARIRDRPPPVATGAFSIWERVLERAPAAARDPRPRTPLSAWLLVLALALGALALAGPRVVAPAAARTWTAVLDLAPPTALAWTEADGPAPERAETRLERAVAAAREWLRAHAGPADRVRWLAPGADELWTEPGAGPDAAWLADARRAADGERPSPAAFDRPGALLVTDRAPDPPPAAAGWFASGGAAVHGPVAADPGGLWTWDGATLARTPAGDGAGGRLALDASAGPLPPSVADLAATWAAVRGVTVVHGARDARLVLRAAPAGAEPREAEVGRDGWRGLARYPAGGLAPGDGRVWLAAPDRAPLVRARPGRIDVALAALEPHGDPALFAVSLGALLDAAYPAHPAVVPLETRAAAGPPSSRAPTPPPDEHAPGDRSTRLPLDAWCAALAAALAFVSLAVGRGGG